MARRRGPYQVRLTPAAARQLRKLDADSRKRVEKALGREAGRASTAKRGGKAVKTIRGRGDSFVRLRVGDQRVMFDLLQDEHVLLVLGIVHRRDLERWLRGRAG